MYVVGTQKNRCNEAVPLSARNICKKILTILGSKIRFIYQIVCYPIFSSYIVCVNSVGAKSQILSSVAPPRKKNLVTIFSQGHVLGLWKPMFY